MDDPASINFEDMLNWTDPDNLSLDDYKFRQFGRMGTCFIAIGLYVNVLCAKLIVPDWSSVNKEEEEEEPDEEVSDVLRQPVKLSMVKVAQLYMSVIFTLIVCGVLMFRFHEEFTWVRPASPVPLLVRERWQEVPARR